MAEVTSFVDLYRPKYGLLENVPGIVQNRENRNQDVFSQLIYTMVGLGYQTQFYFLDASSCGNPQRRSRVFVVFAAPSCDLPRQPQQTHSHPPNMMDLGIGMLPNSGAMTRRQMQVATPFKYVSAKEATADFPPIQDSKPDIGVSYPDHRVALGIAKQFRLRIYQTPTRPYGMNFSKAWFGLRRPVDGAGVLTIAEREILPAKKGGLVRRVAPNSQAYGRQDPKKLIETITTQSSPHDAKAAKQIHWRENRPFSVMEARRAQGFRDDEILLGEPMDQCRIVGNSVAREVSVALGIVFREAWAATLKRGGTGGATVPTTLEQE